MAVTKAPLCLSAGLEDSQLDSEDLMNAGDVDHALSTSDSRQL